VGSSPVQSGQELAREALIAASIAAPLIPAAWPCVAIIYAHQCDPGALYDVGQEWFDLADELSAAYDAVEQTAGQLPADQWSGLDRDAFDQKRAEYQSQLMGAMLYALVVGGALVAVATLLFAFILIMTAVANLLALEAALIAATLAGIVTAPAAAALEAEANAFAAEMAMFLGECAAGVALLSQLAALAVGGGIAVDVAQQYLSGDKEAFTGLRQATKDGADNIIWGSLSRLERDITAIAIGGGGPLGAVVARPKGIVDQYYPGDGPTVTGTVKDGSSAARYQQTYRPKPFRTRSSRAVASPVALVKAPLNASSFSCRPSGVAREPAASRSSP